MSNGTPVRHALGLPAGSVRATHLLFVVFLTCLILLIPGRTPQALPPFLIYLLFLMLGHYFGHRSAQPTAAGEPAPLYLPRGSIRLISILALGGTIGWLIYSDPEGLKQRFDLSLEQLKAQPYLPLLILGGFFLGTIVRTVLGRDHSMHAVKNVEAWVSILALVGLAVSMIIYLIINPSLEKPAVLPFWEGMLAALIAFYFGERS